MRNTGAGDQARNGTHASAVADTVQDAQRARLSWKKDQLRFWDLLQLSTPWLLLTAATAVYFAWVLPRSAAPFWPEGASVLSLIAVAATWVLCGSTLPIKRRTLRPVPTAIYFVGLLALCIALLMHSDIFVIFTIGAFFHAYLLTPWPLGVLGVFLTAVALNGMTMRVWADPTPETLVTFILIVLVQTAAVGIGIPFSSRSEIEEGRREKLVAQLETALHENAGLHAQLVAQARESGAQDERQRLAGEIHDTLAQGLAGIITQLHAAERSGDVQGDAEAHVVRALKLARSSLSEARRSVQALAPRELGSAHLPEALGDMAARWSEEEGVPAQVQVTGAPVPLIPAIDLSLFRVAQEALTNVAKHAVASRVGVTLSYTGSDVLLDVRDDGRGFSGGSATGFGLTSMRHRIRGIGGHLEVQSAPDEGTSVSARVPAIALTGTGADMRGEQEAAG